MPNEPFIPVCEPYYVGNEIRYVTDAVESGWISSSGEYISKFESAFAKCCNRSYATTANNGTTALHLAMLALDIKSGDEVILPNFTMVAALASVLYCGATPVFVDAESDTWNMDVTQVENKITPRTKAILVAHTYGHPVEMAPLEALSKKHSIPIVEDAAEAHGALYHGRPCGSFGALSCFSFFGNKIITTGEGGMVLSDDKTLIERCQYFKNHCFAMQGPRDYIHQDLGYNYRMTNLQAALGLAQTEKLATLVELRRTNAARYNAQLANIPGLQLPVERPHNLNVYWMYGIVVDPNTFGFSRDVLMQELRARNIDTRLFFRPLHSQPLLAKHNISVSDTFPVTELLGERGLYLPSGSGLSEEQITRVCRSITEIHKAHC